MLADPSVIVEVCVEGIDGFLAAQEGGADRIELCASLVEGGLTPSIGVVRAALQLARVPFHVIVRPRGGDFLYSAAEYDSMLEDVAALRTLGVAGVVIGCLLRDGRIDEARMARLIAVARPLSVTCHRAFDMARDGAEAVEALARLGVDRILTSGQCDRAIDGLATLARTVRQARGRVKIMACGGLDADNIRNVLRETQVDELHFAAPRMKASGMMFRNPGVAMGGAPLEREYQIATTDAGAVRRTIAAVRAG